MTDQARVPNETICLHCKLLETIDNYRSIHRERSRTAVIGELVQVIADLVMDNGEHTVGEQTRMIVDTLLETLVPSHEIAAPSSGTQH